MTTPEVHQVRRFRSYFGFSRIPFNKSMCAANMFDSSGQRELVQGLNLWTDVRGISVVTGPSGVGKSISLRRFTQGLDSAHFRVIEFSYLPSTVHGFLRSLNRSLGLPMRQHTTDLFSAAQDHLTGYQQESGPHPIIVIDDAEGLSASVIDTIRRLTCYCLDSDDRFSILLAGTDELLALIASNELASLRSRVVYAYALRPFSLEDTVNYVRFHLQRADASAKLFSEVAIKRIFNVSRGHPRIINQVAIQALIAAAAASRDAIDGEFISALITSHPLFQNQGADR